MAESTLTAPRSEILQAVGDFLDYGRNQHVWTREQTAQINRIVRSAEQQFYHPAGHTWAFLKLELSLSITSGTADYDLPDGFGGFFSQSLAYVAANNKPYPVKQTGVSQLQAMRQQEGLANKIQARWFAVNAKAPTQAASQTFEVLLFPTPNSDGTLVGLYFANPDAMTDSLPYAAGGAVHSETLLACCLAEAELLRDKRPGPMRERYLERLAASIEHDRRSGPKSFGYNGDNSEDLIADICDFRGETLLRNGVPL